MRNPANQLEEKHSVFRERDGYALISLLVSVMVFGILATASLPVWSTVAKREKEAELIFRGEQYVRAVELYQRKVGASFPTSIDVLVEDRYLRRRYADPMTQEGDFRILYHNEEASPFKKSGVRGDSIAEENSFLDLTSLQSREDSTSKKESSGGIIGVVSRSARDSIRLYKGARRYNEWLFKFEIQRDGPGSNEQNSAEN